MPTPPPDSCKLGADRKPLFHIDFFILNMFLKQSEPEIKGLWKSLLGLCGGGVVRPEQWTRD